MKHYRLRALIALAPLALVAAECPDLTDPIDDGLQIELALSSNSFHIGQEGAIVMRLRNLTVEPVVITFSSTCQLNLFIRRVRQGPIYPAPGGHACGDAITGISLPPFGEHSEVFRIVAIHEAMQYARHLEDRIFWTGFPLIPGHYSVHVELGHNYDGVQLRSREVKFEIRG